MVFFDSHAQKAEDLGVPAKCIPSKGIKSREEYDMKVNEVLEMYNIDLVCLAGFMRIISDQFINLWRGRLINIHPSLLPSFKGTDFVDFYLISC